jgi:hypothetical protein
MNAQCSSSRSDLRLFVQQHVQQGPVDLDFAFGVAVVFDETQLSNLFMKKLTWVRLVPIISASVS